jgi:hypothetical protein
MMTANPQVAMGPQGACCRRRGGGCKRRYGARGEVNPSVSNSRWAAQVRNGPYLDYGRHEAYVFEENGIFWEGCPKK